MHPAKRILLVHNAYSHPGGEDVVFSNERQLLTDHGLDVRVFAASNTTLSGLFGKLLAGAGAVFSVSAYVRLRRSLRAWRPDVVHVHNFFPKISPSVFYACRAEGVPVVLTLHNYRIVCPTETLLHNGIVTERSLTEGPWWGVRERVYRTSFAATFILAVMISVHRRIGTWQSKVDRFIVPSQFGCKKFIEAGLPAGKICHKPNFANAPSARSLPRDGLLYVGRLSKEKGVEVMAMAGTDLAGPIKIAGDGPLKERLAQQQNIVHLGWLGFDRVREEMARAVAVVVPSVCYETFGLAVVEAFSTGTPVLASNIGALSELVEDGVTGLLVNPNDVSDLRDKMQWALANKSAMSSMGNVALNRFRQLYARDPNFERLMAIYQDAIDSLSGAH